MPPPVWAKTLRGNNNYIFLLTYLLNYSDWSNMSSNLHNIFPQHVALKNSWKQQQLYFFNISMNVIPFLKERL